MKRSTDRIRSTHTGRLFMPDAGWLGMGPQAVPADQVSNDVTTLVQKQIDIGMDAISNGEPAGIGPRTVFATMDGIELHEAPYSEGEPTFSVERIPWATREMLQHASFYSNMYERGGTSRHIGKRTVISGPLKLRTLEPFERDIAIFNEVLARQSADVEAFYCVVAPGWLEQFVWNEYYGSDEEFLGALAEAMAPIYKLVTDNGLILQIDDPAITKASEEARRPIMTDEEYQRFFMVRVDALNAALEGIPEEMIRYHFCWGSGPGLHIDEVPLLRFAEMMLKVKAQAYSIESAKSPHRMEWKVWRDHVKWPEDKIIIPGVVDHTTNVVEPPDVIADQLIQFANVCGRENVMAGTDCGMRGHAEANWAKYENIVRGADLASMHLWG